MSTKYIESHENKEWRQCKLCGGDFVPGGVLVKLPEDTCIWCFSRTKLYRRFNLLWEGLQQMYQEHGDEECSCKGCQIYRAAVPVMLGSTHQNNELPEEG